MNATIHQLPGIPKKLHTVEDVLGQAMQMNLPNIFIISELENGDLIILNTTDFTLAEANWLCDRAKKVLSSQS